MEEIETGIESTDSGVSEGASSDASGSNPAESAPAKAAGSENKPDTTPFHEHPRFKELVEQKNEALRRHQEMESRYKAIEQQLGSLKDAQPKPQTEFDALLGDLKKIDPRLAAALESAAKGAETSKSLQARLDAFEKQSQEASRTQTVQSAVAKINSLHESNKMSDFGKQFINNQLDLAYRSGQLNAGDVKAIEAAYGESAKAIKAYEDSLKRSVTESYVQAKKTDASVPASQPKGSPAKAGQKPLNVPKDKDAMKAAVVKSFLKEQAAGRDATNV